MYALPVNEPQQFSDQVQSIWQARDGLPETNIQALAQTPDHYLWIGTTGGLLRFDGEEFTVFDHENTPALPVDNIASLLVAHDGTLWIGTNGGGLVRHDRNGFRAYTTALTYGSSFVRTLLEDNAGNLWIGTLDGLFLMVSDHVVRVPEKHITHKLQVFSMTMDRSGDIWIGGPSIYRVRDREVIEYPFGDPRAQTAVESILASDDGKLWVGTYSGLFSATISPDGEPTKFTRINGIEGTIHTLKAMPGGSFWIGTVDRGIYTYANGALQHLTTPSPLPSNEIFSILEDVEKNVWIGTLAGLVRLSNSGISVAPLAEASNSDTQTVYADPQGPVWIASAHLFRFDGNTMSRVQLPALANVQVQSVLRDSEQTLWFGTQGQGLFNLRGDKVIHYTPANGLANGFIRALVQTHDGSMLAGTPGGLYRRHGGEVFERIKGWAESSIRTLREDHLGNLWIGTDQGLHVWRDGAFTTNAATVALQHIPVWAIREDSEGGLWFGTAGQGLFLLQSGHLSHFSSANGLPSNKIFEILEDQTHRLWFSSPNGVSLIAVDALKTPGAERSTRLPLTFYGASEGTLSTQLLGGIQPAGAIGKDGNIWFPSIVGPLRISPAYTARATTVPIVLHQLMADGRSLPVGDSMRLGASVSQLEIHYGAIELRSQGELRFSYKLDGFDKQWNDAGSRRVAYYTNLPPGHYMFRVAVSNLSAPEVTSTAAFPIAKEPHVYQSYWFYALCIAFAAAIVATAYRLRTRRMQHEFQAVLRERSRIAWEMHDTFLQGCASVSSLLEGLSMAKAFSNGNERVLLDSARSQVSSTIEDARKAVWDLRHHALGQSDIGQLIHDLDAQIEKRESFSIDYSVEGEPLLVHQAASHQLLMVVREALLNATRHANPTKVRLFVLFSRSNIQIEIEDNGTGFDVDTPPEGTHYGLAVMRERIQNLNGRFVLESTPARGTRIKISVPLNGISARITTND